MTAEPTLTSPAYTSPSSPQPSIPASTPAENTPSQTNTSPATTPLQGGEPQQASWFWLILLGLAGGVGLLVFTRRRQLELVFLTGEQNIRAGAMSDEIVVQARRASGEPYQVRRDTEINVSGSSLTGRFALTKTDTRGNAILTLTMPAKSSTIGFYYLDATPGFPEIRVENPREHWKTGAQRHQITSG